MLSRPPSPLPRPEITPNRPIEDLHHEPKQVPRQCCVPPPLARLVPNKRMLRLHLEELHDHHQLQILCEDIFNPPNNRRCRPPTSYG